MSVCRECSHSTRTRSTHARDKEAAMSQPSSASSLGPQFGASREEVRQRYLGACASSQHGGPPPDLDSLLAAFDEPERSQLRSELLAEANPGAITTELGARDTATVEVIQTPEP